jgi:hypothetical protein
VDVPRLRTIIDEFAGEGGHEPLKRNEAAISKPLPIALGAYPTRRRSRVWKTARAESKEAAK